MSLLTILLMPQVTVSWPSVESIAHRKYPHRPRGNTFPKNMVPILQHSFSPSLDLSCPSILWRLTETLHSLPSDIWIDAVRRCWLAKAALACFSNTDIILTASGCDVDGARICRVPVRGYWRVFGKLEVGLTLRNEVCFGFLSTVSLDREGERQGECPTSEDILDLVIELVRRDRFFSCWYLISEDFLEMDFFTDLSWILG